MQTSSPSPPGTQLPVPRQGGPARTNHGIIKKIIIGGAITSGLAAIVAICLIAIHIYTTNTPEYILHQALMALTRQKTIAGTIAVDYTHDTNHYTGTADFVAATSLISSDRNQLTLGTGSGEQRLEVTVRHFENGVAYAKISGLPHVPELLDHYLPSPGRTRAYQDQQTQEFLARLDNNWYTITPAGMTLQQPPGAAALRPAAQAPTVNQLAAAAQLYIRYPFLSIQRQQSNEVIHGTDSLHLELAVSNQKLLAYLQAASKEPALSAIITPYALEQAQHNLQAGPPAVDVWINKATRRLTRVTYTSPGKSLKLQLDLQESIPRDKTIVDRPVFAQTYDQAAADLDELLAIFGVRQ